MGATPTIKEYMNTIFNRSGETGSMCVTLTRSRPSITDAVGFSARNPRSRTALQLYEGAARRYSRNALERAVVYR